MSVSNSSNLCVLTLREGTGAPGGNPCSHNMKTPHRKSPDRLWIQSVCEELFADALTTEPKSNRTQKYNEMSIIIGCLKLMQLGVKSTIFPSVVEVEVESIILRHFT